MSIQVIDFKELINTMCERKELSAEGLRNLFFRRFTYCELVEILCDYINASHLLEHCTNVDDLGSLQIENRALQLSLNNERTTLIECRKKLLQAQSENLTVREQMTGLERENIRLTAENDRLKTKICLLESCARPRSGHGQDQ